MYKGLMKNLDDIGLCDDGLLMDVCCVINQCIAKNKRMI